MHPLTLAIPELRGDIHFSAVKRVVDGPSPLVQLVEHRGGSGDVARAVAAGETDLGFALTESLIEAAENGASFSCLVVIVRSSLTWRAMSDRGTTVLEDPVWKAAALGSRDRAEERI